MNPTATALELTWPEHQNPSIFSSTWLAAHASFTGAATAPALPEVCRDPAKDTRSERLWNPSSFNSRATPLPFVGFHDLDDPVRMLEAFRLLRDVGFVLVKDCPVSMEGTEAVSRYFGPPRATLYGPDMWRTEVRPDGGNDTSYSTVPLRPHTDCTYLTDSPGLQIFHCLAADPSGGDTCLVDGFSVAKHLMEQKADTFNALCDVPLSFHHTDDKNIMIQERRVFERRVGSSRESSAPPSSYSPSVPSSTASSSISPIKRIHFNNDDRLATHPNDPARMQDHIRILSQLIVSKDFNLWMSLRPGTTLIFNNTRVLHGRSGFSGKVQRVLAGCYINEEDWHSEMRVTARALGKYVPMSELR